MWSQKTLLLTIGILGVIITVGLVVWGTVLDPSLACVGSGVTRTFTLVASRDGFNNSKSNAGFGAWPIMTVSKCDKVTMRIVNIDSQDHGVAVGLYSMSAMNVSPGQAITLNFVAYQTGQFRVYCTTGCPVHEYMVNGQLKVA